MCVYLRCQIVAHCSAVGIIFLSTIQPDLILGGSVMNKNDHVVNYTTSGLIPHSQHIVRVMADSTATDTVPAEAIHHHSLTLL